MATKLTHYKYKHSEYKMKCLEIMRIASAACNIGAHGACKGYVAYKHKCKCGCHKGLVEGYGRL
jgi:hypothetical protein